MKVLWLCPIMLPEFAEYFGEKRNPKVGWVSGVFHDLRKEVEIELCCPARSCDDWKKDIVDKTIIYTLERGKGQKAKLIEILKQSNPDVIHVWGTDTRIAQNMIVAAKEMGMLSKVLVNIQAVHSIISKYHYFGFLPDEVINAESPVEYKYKISNKAQHNAMVLSGEREIKLLQEVEHVAGRTDWDEAVVTQINPNIKYHRCGESLRPSFYEEKWKYDSCEKYSIFVSESHIPLKGFHLMLEAMPIILKEFPTAKLYTTGTKPKLPVTFYDKCSQLAYPSYIAKLISENNLEDKVEFLGTLSESKMCERYLKSNVLASPSSIENSSNSIAEAMILGLPVVSSDVGGVTNFIKHGESGYLYQADAPYMLAYYICKVFKDSNEAINMGKKARCAAIKCHDRKTIARDMKEIYEDIIKCEKYVN